MENIRYYFSVDLSTSSIRTLSNEDNGTILYPYKNVLIGVNEVHICPFCGKIVRNLECDCQAFDVAVKKLQSSFGDRSYKSCLHFNDFNINVSISKSISDFKVKKLNKKEILALGPDAWDFAIRHTDQLSDKSYLVSPVTHDGNVIFLYCKDVSTKVVYRFETAVPAYKDKHIYLGVHERKTIPGWGDRKKIGNYRFEYHWNNYVEYENWNEVCRALKEIWNLAGDGFCRQLFYKNNCY